MIYSKPLGYLAHPYSSDPKNNTENSMRVFSELMEFCNVINPLLSHYHDAHAAKKLSYDEWLEYDFALIERCDFVFRNPGESKGADAEVLFAVSKGIPVFSDYDKLKMYLKSLQEVTA